MTGKKRAKPATKQKKEKDEKKKIDEKAPQKTAENRGRKCKYESLGIKKKLNKVKKWRREGHHESQIFEKLGISVSSGEKYKNDFPEFAEALRTSKENMIADLEDNLLYMALQRQKKKIEKRQYVQSDGSIGELVKITIEDITSGETTLKVLQRYEPRWRNLLVPEKENPLGEIPAGITMRPIDEWGYETEALFKRSGKAIDDGKDIDDLFGDDDDE